MTPAIIDAVISQNLRIGQAVSAALMSLEALTPDQFAAKHPGVDIAVLMGDPEFLRLVELFAANRDVQEFALEAQLNRGLSESVTGLVTKIQDPDASGAALCAASDALTKISNLIDRREAAKSEGGARGLFRSLVMRSEKIEIKTLEGVTRINCTGGVDDEIIIRAVRAMRCFTTDEADQVIVAMRSSRPMIVLHLRWL